jgi:hypothetical protein
LQDVISPYQPKNVQKVRLRFFDEILACIPLSSPSYFKKVIILGSRFSSIDGLKIWMDQEKWTKHFVHTLSLSTGKSY